LKKEKNILNLLTKAYNQFAALQRQHPNELQDFADGIHRCQYVIGMRFARMHFSDIFPIKRNKSKG
jgi:hypothetical protein